MIKTFQLQDVRAVVNLQKQGHILDLIERLVHPRSPLQSALLAKMLPAMPVTSTFVLDFSDNDEHHWGLVQTRSRPGRPEQDVIFLAPSLEHGDGSHAVWQRLLAHVCVKAGEAGHHRIYARFDRERDEAQVFRNVGFAAYAEEEIFCLRPDHFPTKMRDTLGLRKQTTADSWSLQRLYAAVTPRGVQIAEGLAQGQWQLNKYFLGERDRRYGYVWEREGEILGVLHIRAGKAGYGFRVLVHPDADDQVGPLIQAGLSIINQANQTLRRSLNKSNKPIYSSLRTYQLELGHVLGDYGFQKIASQVVMVKHTTVRARDVLSRLVTFEAPVDAKPASPTPFIQSEAGPASSPNGTITTKEAAKNGI